MNNKIIKFIELKCSAITDNTISVVLKEILFYSKSNQFFYTQEMVKVVSVSMK